MKLSAPEQLPSGSWRASVQIDGKRIRKTFQTKEAAEQYIAMVKTGYIVERDPSVSVTLGEAIGMYISKKEHILSVSTIRGYESIKRNHFNALLQKEIHKIKKADIERVFKEELKTLSVKTVKNHYGLLRPVFQEFDNPITGITFPQQIKKEKKYLQIEEIKKLMEYAKGDDYEIEILLGLWLGMRRSEICGLCWDAVDFKNNTIHVGKRTLVPDKDNKWVLKDGAKNIYSQRVVPCPSNIMDMIHERYHPRKKGRIFKENPNTINDHLARICEKAGITITTIHGLRHSAAALHKHLNVDDAYAMRKMGWRNEKTYKETYSYLFDEIRDDGEAKINAFFSNDKH